MASRRPLVNVSGTTKEMPTGDTIPVAILGTGTADSTKVLKGDGAWVSQVTGAAAFVNFDGTGSSSANQTIRASSNVSSVYKDSTGHYTINFSSALSDANYSTNVTVMRSSDLLACGGIVGNATYSNSVNTSWVKIAIYNYTGNPDIDGLSVNVAVFR